MLIAAKTLASFEPLFGLQVWSAISPPNIGTEMSYPYGWVNQRQEHIKSASRIVQTIAASAFEALIYLIFWRTNMQLTALTTTAMTTASSPEEAYKIFAGAVSQGLGNMVADALAKALGATSLAAANPAVAGWEKYVNGIAMQMNWGTPGFKAPSTVMTSFSNAVIGTSAAPSIQGGSITIGGTWTF